jgi:uncharacterized protein with HEPN domain
MSGNKKYFNLMALHCDKIRQRIGNLTFDEWVQNDTLQDAVCMRLMALTECVKECLKTNPSLLEDYPDVPWNRIIRFRDKIAHHYEGIDYIIVWELLKTDIQPFYKVISKLAVEQSEE